MRDRAREKEIMVAKTPGKCMYEYKEGDGHVLRMGTALVSRASYETQHIINYEHNLYPEDGEQFDEAEANAQFIARAWTGWPEELEWRERAEKVLKFVEWGSDEQKCPWCGGFKHGRWNGHSPDCELAALLPKESVNIHKKDVPINTCGNCIYFDQYPEAELGTCGYDKDGAEYIGPPLSKDNEACVLFCSIAIPKGE